MQFLKRIFSSQRSSDPATYPIQKLLSVLITTALARGATTISLGTPSDLEASARQPQQQRVPVWLLTGSGWSEIEGLPVELLEPTVLALEAILAPQGSRSDLVREGFFPLADCNESVQIRLQSREGASYRVEIAEARQSLTSVEA